MNINSINPLGYNKFRFYNVSDIQIIDKKEKIINNSFNFSSINEDLIINIINKTDYGGFNLSAGNKPFTIDGKWYNLFCMRYSHDDINVIPGNDKKNNTESKIYNEHLGENFVWGNWSGKCYAIPYCTIIFIGEIDIHTSNIKKVIEIPIIKNYSCSMGKDTRFLYINTEINKAGNTVYKYLLCPRNVNKDRTLKLIYHLYEIIYNGVEFITRIRTITINNMQKCNLTAYDQNLVCYKVEKEDDEKESYEKYKLHYFNWYKDNKLTRFIFRIYIPLFDTIYDSNIEKYNDDDSEGRIIPMQIFINNNFLIGDDLFECRLHSLTKNTPENESTLKSHAFSFGSNFIDIGNNIYIGIGHIKI